MSKFTPMEDKAYAAYKEEQAKFFTWPAGWYDAVVSDAPDGCTEGMGGSGNLYYKTVLRVYNAEGREKLITAYIMAEGKAAWQLRAAAEAFGVLDEYRAGNFDEDTLKGKSAQVRLAVETDPNGVYQPKNVIKDFRKNPKVDTRASSEAINDSIPF